MTSLVFMFPGQTSRYPEMIEKLITTNARCAGIVATASEILGRDLVAHYNSAKGHMFARNRDVQIAVFLANHLHLKILEGAGIHADWSLGLSLGEYNHLVHIGALSFEDALRLIEERGMLYEQGPDGLMVSVFPIEAEIVEDKIKQLGLGQRVVIGLYNSPRQQVLSGERLAVQELIVGLEEDNLIEAVETEPHIPMHAPTFSPVAPRLRTVLDRTKMNAPRLPYVPNVVGTVLSQSTPDDIRAHLTAHVHKSVRWQASIDALAAQLPEPYFVEVGPRAVLYNMFGRGWMPGRRAKTDVSENWPDHIKGLIAELRHGAR